MTGETLSAEQLAELVEFDTPTICNAIDRLIPPDAPRNLTASEFVCPFPELKPMAGYARTATMRGARPNPLSSAEALELRWVYWEYLAGGRMPAISVVQDLDGPDRGYAAFWGEVNSSVHQGLGCIGTVTDGSIRDLDVIPEGFRMLAGMVRPFGGFAHLVDFGGAVAIQGMAVGSGDLIHAERHGATVIPADIAQDVAAAARKLMRQEKVVIDEAQRDGVTVESLKRAYLASLEVE